MKKYIVFIILIFLAFGAGYYLTPIKEKEVIKYKDKIVKQNQIITKIQYKDGKTVTVTKTDTVEVEKIKEVNKTVYTTHSSELAPIIGISTNAEIENIGLIYYHKFIGSMYLGIGLDYTVHGHEYINVGNNTISTSKDGILDKTKFLISVKIPLNF